MHDDLSAYSKDKTVYTFSGRPCSSLRSDPAFN